MNEILKTHPDSSYYYRESQKELHNIMAMGSRIQREVSSQTGNPFGGAGLPLYSTWDVIRQAKIDLQKLGVTMQECMIFESGAEFSDCGHSDQCSGHPSSPPPEDTCIMDLDGLMQRMKVGMEGARRSNTHMHGGNHPGSSRRGSSGGWERQGGVADSAEDTTV